MGTNFYTLTGEHIGKRSAAGMYCFDCGISLCIAGWKRVHYSSGPQEWYSKCPKCGKEPEKEDLGISAAGLELGFNKNTTQKKTGVQSCSSFTWAISTSKLEKLPDPIIKDEYDRHYTKELFFEMLSSYPIHFTDMIGKEFS